MLSTHFSDVNMTSEHACQLVMKEQEADCHFTSFIKRQRALSRNILAAKEEEV